MRGSTVTQICANSRAAEREIERERTNFQLCFSKSDFKISLPMNFDVVSPAGAVVQRENESTTKNKTYGGN